MSIITAALLVLCIVPIVIRLLAPRKSKDGNKAPGPSPWPLIGNLVYIGKCRDVTEAFSKLAREYGDIVSIKLGVHETVVVSGLKNFRDVLVNKGHLFDARPAFSRFDMYFGNDKNNSLAFCDGSSLHHQSRAKISTHTFMRNGTAMFENLETTAAQEVYNFMDDLKTQTKTDNKVDIKPQMAQTIAKIFVKYFSGVEANTSDPLFQDMVTAYDEIFDEVNEGCVGDVLPFLMNFINKNKIIESSHKIRDYVEKRLVEPRQAIRQQAKEMSTLDENNNNGKSCDEDVPKDLLNSMLDAVEESHELTLDRALFSFEDILGGSSAINHMLVRVLSYISKNPEVQRKIREEVASNSSGIPTMADRLTYTEATMLEALRFVSSGIVPHVATVDTTVDDFSVKKGTIVMFNNFDLNFSSELWDQPEKFMPERFINEEGHIKKPEFFLPFSSGRRSCLGYKLLLNISTLILANLCQSFEIEADPMSAYDFQRGCLAVGKIPHNFIYNLIA